MLSTAVIAAALVARAVSSKEVVRRALRPAEFKADGDCVALLRCFGTLAVDINSCRNSPNPISALSRGSAAGRRGVVVVGSKLSETSKRRKVSQGSHACSRTPENVERFFKAAAPAPTKLADEKLRLLASRLSLGSLKVHASESEEGLGKDDGMEAYVDPGLQVLVEVVSTMRPFGVRGRPDEAEAGFLACVPWLEAQLSQQALAQLHQQLDLLVDDWATPMRVSASQLHGPITSCWLSFCFDGHRWPLWPAFELALRLVLGALSAVAIAFPGPWRMLSLAASSTLSGAVFGLGLLLSPCSSHLGNTLLLLTYLALALTSLANLGYSAGVLGRDVYSIVVLFVSFGTSLPMLAAASLRFCAVAAAVTCPSSQVDGKREQCNVDLGLRGPGNSWFVLLPAICRVPVRDSFIFVSTSVRKPAEIAVLENTIPGARPRLEFSVLDYVAQQDRLEPPVALLFGPSADGGHGHQSESVYSDEDPARIVAKFVLRSLGSESSDDVTKRVMQLLKKEVKSGEIFVVVLTSAAGQSQAVGSEDSVGSWDNGEVEALLPNSLSISARERYL
ncbi:unnamed protein product [Polarella glacialis]|uniref:Uncharacterized protein n=1 Tax=Polarella glacialis TaxID=89957 RepID=A0A813FRR7_POLGL|nr:unnamed protein product [Polarella glacialis]